MYCIDKKDISLLELYFGIQFILAVIHCLISYAIQQNLAKFQLVKIQANTMFEYKITVLLVFMKKNID